MASQFRRAIPEMPPRLHFMDSSIGLKNTPREKSAPMAMQMTITEAPSTIHP